MPAAGARSIREYLKRVRTFRALGNRYRVLQTCYALRDVPDFVLRHQRGQYNLSFIDRCGYRPGELTASFAFDFTRWAWVVQIGGHTLFTERCPLWELIMELRGYLLAYVPQPGDGVLDVGASTGFISAVLAKLVSASGRVICLEPNPIDVDALRATLALNSIHNCTVVEAALACVDQRVQLTMAGGASRLVTGAEAGSRTVKAISLPTLLAQMPPGTADGLRMIKLDVEGAEVELLDDLLAFLRDHPRTVINIAAYHNYQGGETRSWIEARCEAHPFVVAKTIFPIHATTVLMHADNLAGRQRLAALPAHGDRCA